MDDNDKLQVEKIFRDALRPLEEQFKDYGEKLRETRQTIYGSDERGGMKKTLFETIERVDELDKFKTQIKTVAVTVLPAMQLGITIFVMWIKSLWMENK